MKVNGFMEGDNFLITTCIEYILCYTLFVNDIFSRVITIQ